MSTIGQSPRPVSGASGSPTKRGSPPRSAGPGEASALSPASMQGEPVPSRKLETWYAAPCDTTKAQTWPTSETVVAVFAATAVFSATMSVGTITWPTRAPGSNDAAPSVRVVSDVAGSNVGAWVHVPAGPGAN